MEPRTLFPYLGLAAAILLLAGPAGAFVTPESIVAAGNVYVSKVVYDPGALFTGDTGTFTVYVTNGNANQSVVVNHATLSGNDIRLISSPYDTSANIGPLQTRSFIFSIGTDAFEGDYYPTFSLSFRDADSLYYRSMVRVDNTPLTMTISDRPDTFSRDKKKAVSLTVANPRKNNVTNVAVEIQGEGISTVPDRIFIGDLAAGEKVPVNFSVTPAQETTAHLVLSYDNGNNPHTVSTDFPIAFGTDKKKADPVMSNVQVKAESGTWHVTGDVNNAGLETANTVTVTVLSPALPQDPYKTYVVGALKPDDFGSFEVTFTADPGTTVVPVQLSYKDSDGNIYSSVQDITVSSRPGQAATTGETGGGLPAFLPVVLAIALILIFVGGWAYYLKRNPK